MRERLLGRKKTKMTTFVQSKGAKDQYNSMDSFSLSQKSLWAEGFTTKSRMRNVTVSMKPSVV